MDENKNIEKENLNNIVHKDTAKILLNEGLKTSLYNGEITYENKKYKFLKVILENDKGSVVVFKDNSKNVSMNTDFIIRSSCYIIVYTILGFLGSLFTSKMALVPIKKDYKRQIDFTADASHELRTPLAVIQTNIELVMDNNDETVESQKKWLNNILTENQRMSKLVDELLTLSRADTERTILEKKLYI